MSIDAGLQPERTAMSWRRTALSATGVAVLLAVHGAQRGWDGKASMAVVGLVTMVALALTCRIRVRELQRTTGEPAATSSAPVVVSATVACAALVYAIGLAVHG